MNKIDELIERLCPNGVKYKTLREICIKVQDGNYGKDYPKANELQTEGIPLINGKAIHGEIIREAIDYISEEKNEQLKKARIMTNDVLFLNRGNIGETAMVTEEYNNCNIGPQVTLLRANCDIIMPKFLYYILHSEYVRKIIDTFTGSTIKFVSVEPMRNIAIPVPPIEIQNEIVDILDHFTLLSEELLVNLSEELKNRQKQYEYYRENLLYNNLDAKWVRLLDVADTFTGLTYKPSDLSKEGTLVLRSSNIKRNRLSFEDNVYVKMKNIPQRSIVKENDILICVRNGSKALIGKSAIISKHTEEMAFGAFMTILRAKECIIPKYLYFVWQSSRIQNMIHNDSGMPINQITKKMMEEIVIPCPSIKVQEDISNKIENIEKLSNNIIDGLITEIEARKKQYEYYRDKLLTFKELNVEN